MSTDTRAPDPLAERLVERTREIVWGALWGRADRYGDEPRSDCTWQEALEYEREMGNMVPLTIDAAREIHAVYAAALAAREEAEREAEGTPTIHPHDEGGYVWSYCPEHGPDVQVDEDGCCGGCGRDAVFYGRKPPPSWAFGESLSEAVRRRATPATEPARCDCGAALSVCRECAVADYQAEHPDCRTCCSAAEPDAGGDARAEALVGLVADAYATGHWDGETDGYHFDHTEARAHFLSDIPCEIVARITALSSSPRVQGEPSDARALAEADKLIDQYETAVEIHARMRGTNPNRPAMRQEVAKRRNALLAALRSAPPSIEGEPRFRCTYCGEGFDAFSLDERGNRRCPHCLTFGPTAPRPRRAARTGSAADSDCHLLIYLGGPRDGETETQRVVPETVEHPDWPGRYVLSATGTDHDTGETQRYYQYLDTPARIRIGDR